MLLLVTLLAVTVGEPAAVAPKPAQPAAEAAADDKPICVTKAKVGTRFKERICYNRAEYARRQEEERKALDRMQRVPANCKQTGGC